MWYLVTALATSLVVALPLVVAMKLQSNALNLGLKSLRKQLEIQIHQTQQAETKVTDLLNRLQSEDFRTYSVLTHSEAPTLEQMTVPMTDLEELKRLQQASGVGEQIYDDGTDDFDDPDFRDALAEFGIEFGSQSE